MSKAFEAKDVTLKINNRTVLNDINMCIERGSICAVCGGEDSGKEYLKNMLLRSYDGKHRLTGDMTVNGVEIEKLDEKDARYSRMMDVGVLPLEISADISKYMTGKSYAVKPFDEKLVKSKKEILVEVKRLLHIMRIKNPDVLLRKRTASMTKKELRALYYACVIAASPSVIIAYGYEDGMDKTETDELYTLIIKICKIKNMALIVLTDDTVFAEKFCERIFYLKDEQIYDTAEDDSQYIAFKKSCELEEITKSEYSDIEVLDFSGVKFDKKDLYTINEKLYLGEILGIYANGNDKIDKVILGEKKTGCGEILTSGVNIRKLKRNERGIFVIDENMLSTFPENKTVKEIINECALNQYADKKTDRSIAVYSALNLSGIGTGRTDVKAEELSRLSGVKLGIACALAAGIKTLVIKGLETLKNTSRHEVIKVLNSICKEQKFSAVIISDDRKLLNSVCHKVLSE